MNQPTVIFEWTTDTAREMIEARGAVVDIGQVTPDARRWLTAETKAGRLLKYRGYWTTLSRVDGMGPLKTIWCISTPETRAYFGGDEPCPDCGGAGEYFGHADDCDSDSCALNGDIDSCNGQVFACHCQQ